MFKRIIILLIAISMMLSGCQLAQRDSADGKLIGVLVTDQSYGDGTVLYAHLSEAGECYVFDEGFALLCPEPPAGADTFSMTNEAPISHGLVTLGTDRFQPKTGLTGTVYVTLGGDTKLFFHPVYQDKDGNVFARCDIHYSTARGREEEGVFYQWSSRWSSNESDSFQVSIQVSGVYSVTQYRLLHMDARMRILHEDCFPADQMPDAVTAAADTQYIIIETYKAQSDGTTVTEAEIYDRNDPAAQILGPFGEEYQISRTIQLNWP